MQSRKWRVAADDSACGCGIPFTIHLSRVELGATSGLKAWLLCCAVLRLECNRSQISKFLEATRLCGCAYFGRLFSVYLGGQDSSRESRMNVELCQHLFDSPQTLTPNSRLSQMHPHLQTGCALFAEAVSPSKPLILDKLW